MEVLSGILMMTGAALALIAGIGLQRFDDVFARMHAATKPATLGLALVLGGAALQVPDAGNVAKLMLVVLLQFITAPVGSHLIGRAAHRSGTELGHVTVDELSELVAEESTDSS
ncbi:MAG: multicomponent Na+:H+ antiporter subunit G [Myxococcota bacterium]|jgi:multicomponent Na+:H+ antiporter subunit G